MCIHFNTVFSEIYEGTFFLIILIGMAIFARKYQDVVSEYSYTILDRWWRVPVYICSTSPMEQIWLEHQPLTRQLPQYLADSKTGTERLEPLSLLTRELLTTNQKVSQISIDILSLNKSFNFIKYHLIPKGGVVTTIH